MSQGRRAMQTKAQIDLKRGLWFSSLPEPMQEDVLRSAVRSLAITALSGEMVRCTY